MCDLLIVLLSCPISKAVHGRRNLFQAQASPADPLLFSRTILSALYNVSKQTFRFFPNPRRMRTREFLLTFKLLKTAGQRSQRRAVKNIWSKRSPPNRLFPQKRERESRRKPSLSKSWQHFERVVKIPFNTSKQLSMQRRGRLHMAKLK